MIISGKALPLLIDNVDTDQIIAAKHLKTLTRAGLGRHAFAALRSSCTALTDPEYDGAPIFIAGRNFGCGSSREHAVWAILDMGVRAIIAESFSDLFASNAFKKGLLTVTLPQVEIAALVQASSGCEISIDLDRQEVTCCHLSFAFQMDPFRHQCLLEGIDEIDLTLTHETAISDFEARIANDTAPS